MKELENIRDTVLKIFSNDEWVQWIHEGLLPAYTSKEKERNIELAELSNHCAICRNINGCCFPKNNNINYPLHPNCHCYLVEISKPQITSECPKEKFTEFIFDEFKNKGKKEMFEDWGYDIMNSKYLQNEFTKQAKEQYSKGNFVLGKLDGYGQRITIRITLERKDGQGSVNFDTGWMVYPDGNIKNATPYGGK